MSMMGYNKRFFLVDSTAILRDIFFRWRRYQRFGKRSRQASAIVRN
jgi:hypothetical protein